MNYPWPLEEIVSQLDTEPLPMQEESVRKQLADLGVHRELVELLQPLYARSGASTFFKSTLRLHPLAGDPEHGVPDLVAWNHPQMWKQYEPKKVNDTFYFCSNSFGDQFGIPVTQDGGILHDRIGVLWVERFTYQEAKVPWHTFFTRLAAEEAMQKFFLRTDEHAWAAQALGAPPPWQCFSSNVPAMLGGSDSIDNVSVQAMAVHVSFTLQLIAQAQQQSLAGRPLGMADLRDSQGEQVP